MNEVTFPKTGQGTGIYDEKLDQMSFTKYGHTADEDDLERDDLGFTNPNLHRRIDPQQPEDENEYFPRKYQLEIQSVNSYRTTESFYHDENSDVDEIP